MGAPTGPRVKEHNGGGVMEPDTQALAGTLAFNVKRPLYATSIIHWIHKTSNQEKTETKCRTQWEQCHVLWRLNVVVCVKSPWPDVHTVVFLHWRAQIFHGLLH